MSETVNEEMGNTPLLTNSSSHPPTHSQTHSLNNSSTHLPNNTPILQVKHLSKRYQIGMDRTYKTLCESITDTIKSPLKRLKSFSRQEETFWALKDINFEVYPGEVVGIIGRNGAGKSTLLKILSRITHPTEGEVILRGRVASLLEVGTGFHPELTGRENIYFNGAILGMTKQEIEDKFDEIVEFSGVKDFLDTPLKRYSSGMQVRLAFAVAAHLEPEILVVDEVLAVGDAAFQKNCLGKMKEVSEGGRTVLFVSHNMAAIKKLCAKCILLDSGSIAMEGKTDEVVSKYLTSEVILESEIIFKREEKEVQILRARILNQKNECTSLIQFGETLIIEIRYNLRKRIKNCLIGFEVFNPEGTCIFTTTDMDTGEFLNEFKEAGEYVSQAPLDTKNLKCDSYYLKFYATTPKYAILDSPAESLKFEIIDNEKSLKSLMGTGRNGVIEPVIKWKTTRIG